MQYEELTGEENCLVALGRLGRSEPAGQLPPSRKHAGELQLVVGSIREAGFSVLYAQAPLR